MNYKQVSGVHLFSSLKKLGWVFLGDHEHIIFLTNLFIYQKSNLKVSYTYMVTDFKYESYI